jgi:hypothetical protein
MERAPHPLLGTQIVTESRSRRCDASRIGVLNGTSPRLAHPVSDVRSALRRDMNVGFAAAAMRMLLLQRISAFALSGHEDPSAVGPEWTLVADSSSVCIGLFPVTPTSE